MAANAVRQYQESIAKVTPEAIWAYPDKYFPGYHWEPCTTGVIKHSLGAPPAAIRAAAPSGGGGVSAHATSHQWKYGLSLFEPLWWYWHAVAYETTDPRGTTFLELALEFYFACRERLALPGDDSVGSVREQSNFLAAASRRMADMVKSELAPVPQAQRLPTLMPFGWPPLPGITCRVRLLFPEQVRAVLIRAALAQQAGGARTSWHLRTALDWLPDYGPFVQPIIRPACMLKRTVGPEDHPPKRLRGKQQATPTHLRSHSDTVSNAKRRQLTSVLICPTCGQPKLYEPWQSRWLRTSGQHLTREEL